MDDSDALDQEFGAVLGASNVVVDEDRAYRRIVGRARSRVMRRRLAASASAAVVAALVIGAVVASQRDPSEVRVEGGPPSTTATTRPANFPQIAGMVVVADRNGAVGYVPDDLIHPRSIAAIRAQNARTLIPVTLGDGTLVGYMAQAVPFISLAEAKRPGFDIEAVRAQQNGGCEPQIGDPSFKQEFPLCPPPVSEPAPPTLGRRFGDAAPYQRGIGEARPASIFLGGDPTGLVRDVEWQSWGGERATGRGTGNYEGPGKIVADAVPAPATVVAFDLGNCFGTSAYRAVEWFYPQHGGAFDAHNYINICTGDYVGNP